MTALNPVFTIGWQIDEALKYHTTLNKIERREKAIEMLRLVEMPNPEKRANEYRQEKCETRLPNLGAVRDSVDTHSVRCFYPLTASKK